MKKKKGFTLIELLAVIVVLAIIALIATPIVMNLIKNATKGAAERTADNYLSAVETMIATERLEQTPVQDGTYTIGTDGSLCLSGTTCTEETKLKVEINGNAPTDGKVVISNGQVVNNGTKVLVGDYTVKYNTDGKLLGRETATIPFCELVSGDALARGSKYVCDPGDGEHFFYLLESSEDSSNVTLIMDRNIDDEAVLWCEDETKCKVDGSWNHSAGPITALAALETKTSGWTSSKIIDITLPTVVQITTFNATGTVGITSSPWLYDYLDNDTNTSMQQGYWLEDPSNVLAHCAYYVWYYGQASNLGHISGLANTGIRPVITVAKTDLQ